MFDEILVQRVRVGRQPALPRLHPRRAHRAATRSTGGRRARRSTAAAGWRAPARSTPRTRRCAGSPTWPGCPAGGRLFRLRAAPSATSPPSSRPATPRWPGAAASAGAVADRRDRRGPLLDRSAAQVMDVDVLEVAGRRARPDDRRRRSRRDRRAGRRGPLCRGRDVGHHQPRDHRRPRRHRRGRPGATCGCTSTARTAAPRSPRPRVRPSSRASSRPTASSSIRTSGCSRRSTAARCSTATRSSRGGAHPARRLPRRDRARDEWNPADYAVHLSRRARGLPFWFSLAVHGTAAYSRDRVDARGHPGRAPRRSARARARAPERAGAVGAVLPPHGWARRTTSAGARTSWSGRRLRDADGAQGRDRDAVCHRQPAHHPHRYQSHTGYDAVNGGLIPLD